MRLRNNILLHFVYILSICLIGFSYSQPAFANTTSFRVSPSLTKITAFSPDIVDIPFSVENYQNEPADFVLQLKAFKTSAEKDGQPVYLSEEEAIKEGYPFLFAQMRLVNFSLLPREKKTISFVIDLSKHQLQKDYYFSIFFISKNNISIKPKGNDSPYAFLNHSLVIASHVLLSVNPKDQAKGVIEEFSAPYFIESGPVAFTVVVRNTGDHVITPKGKILIKNIFGQTVGQIPLKEAYILKGSSRILTNILWPEKFLLGAYSASLILELSQSGPTFEKNILFISFPIMYAFILVVAGLIIIALISRIRHASFQ